MPTSASKSRSVWQRLALAFALSAACAVAQADPVSFAGSVIDCNNSALIGSGPNTPAPSCTTPQDQANNVALYTYTVPFGGFTDFTFGGFSDIEFAPLLNFGPAATEFQPYLTIFQGTGDSATYYASSPHEIVIFASSADLQVFLAAGTYTLAISNQANHAVSEAFGGTLGQGFAGTGDPALLGNGQYQLTATAVPEPDSTWLAAIGVAALLLRRRHGRRVHGAAVDLR